VSYEASTRVFSFLKIKRKIHTFDNGVKVYDDHLIAVQRERYQKRNVHEADEEDIFVEIIRDLSPHGCFVNIGCAIGYYAFLAKRLTPGLTIHAVEPLRRHREFFLENIRLNGFRSEDFIIHPEGISLSGNTATFRDLGYGSVIHHHTGPEADLKNMLIIPTKTLDNLIEPISRAVDLVQMDVQGLEADVLRGGLRSLQTGRVMTFLIGTHGAKIHQECMDVLSSYGYLIEFDEKNPQEQPDGIIVASKGVRRLNAFRRELSGRTVPGA
jgi:FkbM family methyltransferase